MSWVTPAARDKYDTHWPSGDTRLTNSSLDDVVSARDCHTTSSRSRDAFQRHTKNRTNTSAAATAARMRLLRVRCALTLRPVPVAELNASRSFLSSMTTALADSGRSDGV